MGAEYIVEGCLEKGKQLLWWVFLIGLLGGCCVGFTWHCSVKQIPESPPGVAVESGNTYVVQSGTMYTVKSGDTLSSIASDKGTTWQELARINKLKDPQRIYPGQVLRIKE